MQWERFTIKLLKPYCPKPGEKLQDLETPLKGMEIALSNFHSFPVKILNQKLKDGLHNLEEHINLTFTHLKNCMPFDLATVPESNANTLMKSLHTLQTIAPPSQQKDLPSFFFLFCLKLLQIILLKSQQLYQPIRVNKTKSASKKGFVTFAAL